MVRLLPVPRMAVRRRSWMSLPSRVTVSASCKSSIAAVEVRNVGSRDLDARGVLDGDSAPGGQADNVAGSVLRRRRLGHPVDRVAAHHHPAGDGDPVRGVDHHRRTPRQGVRGRRVGDVDVVEVDARAVLDVQRAQHRRMQRIRRRDRHVARKAFPRNRHIAVIASRQADHVASMSRRPAQTFNCDALDTLIVVTKTPLVLLWALKGLRLGPERHPTGASNSQNRFSS